MKTTRRWRSLTGTLGTAALMMLACGTSTAVVSHGGGVGTPNVGGPRLPPYWINVEQQSFPSSQYSNGVLQGLAKCPIGEPLLGGGFTTTPVDPSLNHLRITQNYPSGAGSTTGESWWVTIEHAPAANFQLTVEAYCLASIISPIPVSTVVVNTNGAIGPASATYQTVTASCQAGDILTGGGYQVGDESPAFPALSGPSPTTGSSWEGDFPTPPNAGGDIPNSYTGSTFAICLHQQLTAGQAQAFSSSSIKPVTALFQAGTQIAAFGSGLEYQSSLPTGESTASLTCGSNQLITDGGATGFDPVTSPLVQDHHVYEDDASGFTGAGVGGSWTFTMQYSYNVQAAPASATESVGWVKVSAVCLNPQ